MSAIKQRWFCQVNECPYEPGSATQKIEERGFWHRAWEFIKLLFVWVN